MAKKKAAPKKELEVLLVQAKVKKAINDLDCNVASDAVEGLNTYIHWLIEQAAKRAKENNRKTVKGHDFLVTD